jgi:type IV pilus assembly protein PilX
MSRRESMIDARQQGMALIVSLVILLSLTLLGLAAIQNTALEERMAGGVRSMNLALQSAEAGLREGEEWLSARQSQPEPNDSAPAATQVWSYDGPDPDPEDGYEWWKQVPASFWGGAGTREATVDLKYAKDEPPLSNPFYVIEEAGLAKETTVIGHQEDLTGRTLYQITARGLDAGGRSEVLLQSSFTRRY